MILFMIDHEQELSYIQIIETEMKSQLQPRPESKNVNKSIRPATRYINPQLAQQCFKKGKEEQQKQAYGKAIQQYLRALMYDPRYFQAYCNMGKYLQSRSMYLKSIAIKEDDAISHYNLANVLRLIGNYQTSIKHYEFVIGLQQKGNNLGSLYVNSLVNIGICHKIIGQNERAIEYYEKARKIDPKDQTIIYNQAMAYMASLQAMDADIFHEVSKEKAQKAEILFKQLSKANPNNQMATIKLYRISSILDKSTQNLNSIVKKLKQMLSNNKSTLKDDINDLLGFVLKLLKQYQMSVSHYQSMKTIKPPPTSRKQVQTNIYDSASGFVNSKIYTQEQAIKLIEQGQIDQVQSYINRLEATNLSKHVLNIAVELHLYEEEQSNHLIKASNIFNQHFFIDKVELPFEKLTIQAHKIIGKLLATQGKYKQSIKHFEYISSQLKSNAERSKIHSSLGNDYQALGDKQKALQQYKLALSEQPENYQLVYNVGCCLHQIGNQSESNKYFEKFLALIEKDSKVYLPTKNLYIADCLVTMAGSSTNSPEEFKLYEKAWKAIKQVNAASSEQNTIQFEEDKLTSYYLRWADLLEEKIFHTADKKSQEFITTKETLLQVYMNLLDTPSCPDRDAILNNCAILYYQQKLYVNALANLNQVVFQTSISLNSLALIYLHLGQHIMATKSIYEASEKDPEDAVISFNKEVIEWIYGISHEGRLFNLIDNSQDSQIVARWHYGLLLIDALSRKLKDQDRSDEQAPHIISQMVNNKANIQQNLSDIDKIKFKFISNLLSQPNNLSNSVSQQILTKCLTASDDIQPKIKILLSELQQEKDLNEAMIGLLLNIFVFTNLNKQNSIRTMLQWLYKQKTQIISFPMDRRVTILQESLTKQYDYNTVNDLIANFCSWECELQDKIITIMHIVQKNYYRVKFRQLLDTQYHIPRHNQTNDCGMTLNRLINLVYRVFNIKSTSTIMSSTVSSIKNDITKRMKTDFQTYMRNQSFSSVTLGQKFTLVTLHANFQTKEECIKFIKQIQKESTHKREVDNIKNCDEIIVIISDIVKISCTWVPRSPLRTSVRSLLRTPIHLHLQSALEIQQNLSIVKEAGGSSWALLQNVQAFN